MIINSSKLEGLDEWLEYIESLHQLEIEFGLQRVKSVFDQIFPKGLNGKVITVGGTNGKGTTCSYLEGMLLAAGYSCGKNISPHIHEFNERISINGEQSDDADIVDAFKYVEDARENINLTYFEFTFLAALVVFERKGVDYLICEVGMGGRLDAVNILSPDSTIITTIGLDHVEWLGNSREKIAMEKVAISRSGKICVIGEVDFPPDAEMYLTQNNVVTHFNQKDFFISVDDDDTWSISGELISKKELSKLPPLSVPHLYQNAACAVLTLILMKDVSINIEQIRSGLKASFFQGRCQLIENNPLTIVDVAHNVDSVRALSNYVSMQSIRGKTFAVCSMLSDKNIKESLNQIHDKIDGWYIAPLKTQRSAKVVDIENAIRTFNTNVPIRKFDSIEEAYFSIKKTMTSDDCVVVFGSFFVVGDILRHH